MLHSELTVTKKVLRLKKWSSVHMRPIYVEGFTELSFVVDDNRFRYGRSTNADLTCSMHTICPGELLVP